MHRPLDRRAGAAVLALCAAGLLVPVAVTRAALPPAQQVRNDPAALRDLEAVVARQQEHDWLVEYRFVRSLTASGAGRLEHLTRIRLGDVRVSASETSAVIETERRLVTCTTESDEPECLPGERDGDGLPEARVLHEVVTRGFYAASRAPDDEVAGEHAECFRLVAVRGVLDGLGLESVLCFAADGVALRTTQRHSGGVDDLTAQRVDRDVQPDEVDAVLRPFGTDLGTVTAR